MTGSIHHVGIAVDDLDAAIARWTALFGATLEHRERVEDQGVEAASLRVGASRIELLAALGADTPVGKFLAKRGPGVHHVAFEAADVGAELARLKADGVELIDAVAPPRDVRSPGRIRPSGGDRRRSGRVRR